TEKSRWSLAPGKTPTGLAYDPAKNRLFASCRSEHVVIIDAANGKILATLPIGKGTDACVFDSGLIFSSSGDGTLTIVEEQADGKFRVQGTLPTMNGARTMAVDPKTHNIFLAAQRYKDAAGAKKAPPVPNS